MAFLQILLFLLFLSFTRSAPSAAFTPSGEFCNNNTKINTTTFVSVNIDIVLTELVATVAVDGYSIASTGKAGIHRVYGLAQCRGDVNTTDCFLCIQDAAKQIRQRCPDQADSRIWYDICFLRYDTKEFFGQVDTSFGIFISNAENVTEPEIFNQKLGALMNKVRSEAIVPANRGFGSGMANLSASDSLYGLAQCTGDLSPLSCAQCLATAVGNFATICRDRKGCQVFYSSCYVGYELYPFS